MRRIESLNDLEVLGRAMFTHDLMLSLDLFVPPAIFDEIALSHYSGGQGGEMAWLTNMRAAHMGYTTQAGPIFHLYRGKF